MVGVAGSNGGSGDGGSRCNSDVNITCSSDSVVCYGNENNSDDCGSDRAY